MDELRVRSEVTAAVRAAPDGETVALLGDDAGRRAVEFAARGWTPTLVAPPERIEAAEPLLRSAPVELVAGGPDDLPASDLVVGVEALSGRDPAGAEAAVEAASAAAPVGVFLDALRGETADAELLDVEAVAAGEGRVQEAGTVRSWLASAFGAAAVESVPAGPLAAAVGRAID